MRRRGFSRTVSSWVVAAGTAFAVACGHGRLVPAPNARSAAGMRETAVAVNGGVRMVATLDDWRGVANRMPEELTPIKVRIVNHSPHPVSIQHDRFWLKGKRGRRYRAVPAIPLDHATVLAKMGPLKPMFATSSFAVAPRYHDIYPDLEPWSAPLERNERSYAKAYARWNDSPPGRELCRMALPEGVLGPNGELTGYLYFEDPTSSENEVTLSADLVSGRDGRSVAAIRIPLRVD
jgi:hypothetical protein